MTIIWKEFVAFVFGAMVRAWGVSQKRKREEDKHGLRISQSWTFALCLPTQQHHWKTVQDEDGQEHFQGPKGSQNSLIHSAIKTTIVSPTVANTIFISMSILLLPALSFRTRSYK